MSSHFLHSCNLSQWEPADIQPITTLQILQLSLVSLLLYINGLLLMCSLLALLSWLTARLLTQCSLSDPHWNSPKLSRAIVSTTVRQDLVILTQFCNSSTITVVLLTANKKFTLLFYIEHKKTLHQCHDNCGGGVGWGETLILIICILMSSICRYNKKLY